MPTECSRVLARRSNTTPDTVSSRCRWRSNWRAASTIVSLEEQMVLAAETRGDFELAATLYAKHLSLLRTAIGRDGR